MTMLVHRSVSWAESPDVDDEFSDLIARSVMIADLIAGMDAWVAGGVSLRRSNPATPVMAVTKTAHTTVVRADGRSWLLCRLPELLKFIHP